MIVFGDAISDEAAAVAAAHGDLDAFMTDVLTRLRSDVHNAMVEASFNPDVIVALVSNPFSVTTDVLPDGYKVAIHNLQADMQHLDQLDNALRRQVHAGVYPDGQPFTMNEWCAQASVVADDIKAQLHYSFDSSYILNIPSSVYLATKKLFQKDLPALAPRLGGLIAAIVGLYILILIK
jgi:hypothetical protein